MFKNLFRGTLALAVASLFGTQAYAVATYSFLSETAVTDGAGPVDIPLTDGTTLLSTTMTLTATGGNLNSNLSGLGIGDAVIDGTAEAITFTFTGSVELVAIDLSGVGANSDDGASVTIDGTTFPLFTNATDPATDDEFNGSTDVWTPATPIAVGTSIVVTGLEGTSTFDIDGITLNVIPEPASLALLGIGGVLLLAGRRRDA